MNFSPVAAAIAPDIEARDLAGKLLRPEIEAAANIKRAEQPSDSALAAIGEHVDALAAVCPLWLASEMR